MEKKVSDAKEKAFKDMYEFLNWLSKKYQKDWVTICEEYEKHKLKVK